MRVLLAGPWIGEFGWEIIKWVPYVRRWAKTGDYDKVIVLTRKSSFPLYMDFAQDLISYEVIGNTKIFVCDNKFPEIPQSLVEKVNPTDTLIPSHGFTYSSFEELLYYLYGNFDIALKRNVVAHARSTGKMGSYRKNWRKEKWDLLTTRLQSEGKSVAFIGSPESSYCPQGAEDLRGKPLDLVMNVLNSSDICVGPSSGPMHLASCCGCPHVVWGDMRQWNSGNVKSNLYDRYKVLWNPFDTPCEYIADGNWNPSVDKVYIELNTLLNRGKM